MVVDVALVVVVVMVVLEVVMSVMGDCSSVGGSGGWCWL